MMFKQLVSGPDVEISARANHSGSNDSTSFGVTWKLVLQSNNPFHLSTRAEDGLVDKFVSIYPPWEVVAREAFDKNNVRHRIAIPSLSEKALKGHFNQELLAWTKALCGTFDVEICGGRLLSPMPVKWKVAAEEQVAEEEIPGTLSLKKLLELHCKHVESAAEATECKVLKANAAFEKFKCNKTEWTAAAFGDKQRRLYRVSGAARKDYFVSPLGESSPVAHPVALKVAADFKPATAASSSSVP